MNFAAWLDSIISRFTKEKTPSSDSSNSRQDSDHSDLAEAPQVPAAKQDTQLARNFYLREFVNSQTAARLNISNIPNDEHIANLRALATEVLQKVRDRFGAVTISSGYRSPELNKRIGGAATSQHANGEAADFEVPSVSNVEVVKFIRDNCEFDQVILEGYDPRQGPNSGWIHVSYTTRRTNRKQVMTATFTNGKPFYSAGINVR